MKLDIHVLTNYAGLPAYATEGAAGMDLLAADEVSIAPREVRLISTGIAIALPMDYEAQIRPRSGLAIKQGLTVLNAPGTIDADYRGEVKIALINHSLRVRTVERGDRIAQLVVAPVTRVELNPVEELPGTERGEGGFGSTG